MAIVGHTYSIYYHQHPNESFSIRMLSYPIVQFLTRQKSPQILRNKLLGALWSTTGSVRTDDNIPSFPEAMVFRQGLLVENVERCAANVPGIQCIGQRIVVNACASPDVHYPSVIWQQLQSLVIQRVLRAFISR